MMLDWDTSFFGFKVSKVSDVINSKSELVELLDLIKDKGIKLTYYSSENELNSVPGGLGELDIKKVDRKITFEKTIDQKCEYHSCIESFHKDFPNQKLIDLAIESGVHSRFRFDERIDKVKFEDLYRQWITNSVNRKIANEVLIFVKDNEIAGFVTIGDKMGHAEIGMIAVDNAFRGKGIGRALMSGAEKWSFEHQYDHIVVVTQAANLAACGLYQNCGYQVKSKEYFYHIWN